MGYQIYKVGKRWGGYGVPAICEHPDCKEKIDRGVSYACGGEPFSEFGCDRYFCGEHKHFVGFKCDGSDEKCDHDDDCECTFKELCERCAKGEASFDYKPETREWLIHILSHHSWRTWRKKNPEEVAELRKQLIADNKKR